MTPQQKHIASGGPFVVLLVLVNAIILMRGFTRDEYNYNLLYLSVPLLVVALITAMRK